MPNAMDFTGVRISFGAGSFVFILYFIFKKIVNALSAFHSLFSFFFASLDGWRIFEAVTAVGIYVQRKRNIQRDYQAEGEREKKIK